MEIKKMKAGGNDADCDLDNLRIKRVTKAN